MKTVIVYSHDMPLTNPAGVAPSPPRQLRRAAPPRRPARGFGTGVSVRGHRTPGTPRTRRVGAVLVVALCPLFSLPTAAPASPSPLPATHQGPCTCLTP